MCSSRRFQWYPTTCICWAMTKPLLWIKLILSHSKGWVGLKTYRLWGIIGIVLMSTCLIHGYFLRSRHFAKPRLFSREISTVCMYVPIQSHQAFGLEYFLTKVWSLVMASTNLGIPNVSNSSHSTLFPFLTQSIDLPPSISMKQSLVVKSVSLPKKHDPGSSCKRKPISFYRESF